MECAEIPIRASISIQPTSEEQPLLQTHSRNVSQEEEQERETNSQATETKANPGKP